MSSTTHQPKSTTNHSFLRQSMWVLIGGFTVILLVIGGSVWTSISHIDKTHHALSMIIEKNMTQSLLFSQMQQVSQQRTNVLLSMAAMQDLTAHKELEAQFSVFGNEFKKYHTSSRSLSSTNPALDAHSILRAQGGIIESVIKQQSTIYQQLIERDDNTNIDVLIKNSNEGQRLMSRAMARLAEIELKTSQQSQKVVQNEYERAKERIFISSAIALLAALFTITLMARFIQHGEAVLRTQATALRKHNLRQ